MEMSILELIKSNLTVRKGHTKDDLVVFCSICLTHFLGVLNLFDIFSGNLNSTIGACLIKDCDNNQPTCQVNVVAQEGGKLGLLS